MSARYQLAPGSASAALQRAVNQAIAHPPGHERLFSNSNGVGVDWRLAQQCHRSNRVIVAILGGMLDAEAARASLGPDCCLARVMDLVPVLDGFQQNLFLAAAGDDQPARTPAAFIDAIDELIEAEGLEAYFERGGEPAMNGFDLRPYGYAEAIAMEGGPGELERTKARAARLPREQRIPLVVVCGLYDGIGARDVFKGRGWSFHGADLGRWLSERFTNNERSARATLRAIGHYCGW